MMNAERFYREKSARELCERLKQQDRLSKSNFRPSCLFARGAAVSPGQPIADVDGREFDGKESQRLLSSLESIRREFPDIFDEYSSVLCRAEIAWQTLARDWKD